MKSSDDMTSTNRQPESFAPNVLVPGAVSRDRTLHELPDMKRLAVAIIAMIVGIVIVFGVAHAFSLHPAMVYVLLMLDLAIAGLIWRW